MRFLARDGGLAGDGATARVFNGNHALEERGVEGLGRGQDEWVARAGLRRFEAPGFGVRRGVVGRAGAKGLAEGFFERATFGVGPVAVNDEGVGLARFEDRPKLLSGDQATLD